MQHHHYQQPDDLYRAQAALMQWVNKAGHSFYLHKGDIGHGLFNGCYGYDPADVFHYWLDAEGKVAAFAILFPRRQTFFLQVAPPLLCGDTHAEMFEYCERETLRIAETVNLRFDTMVVEVGESDPAYIHFIKARGYALDKHLMTMTRHDALVDIPQAKLPPGFHFHDATAADAERLADVHNHSFTNKWDAQSYGESSVARSFCLARHIWSARSWSWRPMDVALPLPIPGPTRSIARCSSSRSAPIQTFAAAVSPRR